MEEIPFLFAVAVRLGGKESRVLKNLKHYRGMRNMNTKLKNI